jgi:hypothetical protein
VYRHNGATVGASPDLAQPPSCRADNDYQRIRIDVKSQAEPEGDRDRYLALEAATATR